MENLDRWDRRLMQEEIDQLYHLLRIVSNITSGPGGRDNEASILYGLCVHLLVGGDYPELARFSAYYGEKFLLDKTCAAIKTKMEGGWQFDRIVDLGSGLQWLGRGLAAKLGMLPALFVDKRAWALTDLVVDIETNTGMKRLLDSLRDSDLIVMSDLIHCLDYPAGVMKQLSRWPIAALEYYSTDSDFMDSFVLQINRYGASLVHWDFEEVFRGRALTTVLFEPYALALVDKL